MVCLLMRHMTRSLCLLLRYSVLSRRGLSISLASSSCARSSTLPMIPAQEQLSGRGGAHPKSIFAAFDGPANAVVMRLLDETPRMIQHHIQAVGAIFECYP